MNCNTCVNYGIYEMITSGKPYGYIGDIPCIRCSRYRTHEDLYTPLSKPSVVSELDIIKALDEVDYHSDDGSIGINQDKEKLCLGEILSSVNIEKIAKCVHNLITKER